MIKLTNIYSFDYLEFMSRINSNKDLCKKINKRNALKSILLRKLILKSGYPDPQNIQHTQTAYVESNKIVVTKIKPKRNNRPRRISEIVVNVTKDGKQYNMQTNL